MALRADGCCCAVGFSVSFVLAGGSLLDLVCFGDSIGGFRSSCRWFRSSSSSEGGKPACRASSTSCSSGGSSVELVGLWWKSSSSLDSLELPALRSSFSVSTFVFVCSSGWGLVSFDNPWELLRVFLMFRFDTAGMWMVCA